MNKMIRCPKCGNDNEFAIIAASVLHIYVNGNGDTTNQESLADACTGVDRVECSICRAELEDVGYNFQMKKAFLYSEKYAKIKELHTSC